MLGIDYNFTVRATEQNIHAIQHISSKDALVSGKVCLKPAGIIAAIEVCPSSKHNRRNGTSTNTSHQAG